MRLVLDINTAISGLIWRGVPADLLDLALASRIRLISSTPLLAELDGVLRRPKLRLPIERRGVSVDDLLEGYAALVEKVRPAPLKTPICRDPDDDVVLATAIAGAAALLVSGDDDLLCLKHHQDILIVNAGEAWQLLSRQGLA